MTTFIGYQTGIRVWNEAARYGLHSCPFAPDGYDESFIRDCCDTNALHVLVDAFPGLRNTRLDVIVRTSGGRRHSKRVFCHVWHGEVPLRSYVTFPDISSEIAVATPSHCLLQLAAARTPDPALAREAMSLCGTYYVDAEEDAGFVNRPVLVGLPALQRAAASFTGMYGALKLENALSLAGAGSASPLETLAYLLAYLPEDLGGYLGIRPQLNVNLEVPNALRTFAGSSIVRPDQLFASQRVAVEIDSLAFHRTAVQRRRDERRRRTLELMGYSVVVITSEMVFSQEEFERSMWELATCLKLPFSLKQGKEVRACARLKELLLPQSLR